MVSLVTAVSPSRPTLTPEQRCLCNAFADPYSFILRYFADRLKSGNDTIKNAQWQIDAIRAWGSAIKRRDERGAPAAGRIAEAWPREFGKTTLGRAVLLWAMLCGYRKYALIFRISAEIAESETADYLRILSDTSSLLVNDFGLRNWTSDIQRRKGLTWSTGKLHVRNILGEAVCIEALGTGSSPRGKEDQGRRPDIISLDDVETTESVLSRAMRTSNARWLAHDIEPLGANALILFKQTTISPRSMMAEAQRSSKWTAHRMPALDEQDESTWPERYSTEYLRAKRAESPASLWLSDYQNLPQSNEATLFPPDSWRIYEDEDQLPPERNGYARLVMGVDLAFSASQASDYTALSVWGETPNGEKHHVGTLRGRWPSPDELIEKMRLLDQAAGGVDKFCVEDTTSSKHFIQMARERLGGRVSGVPVGGLDKTARARMIMAAWELRRVWRRKSDTLIVESLYSFRPDVKDQEDDVLDATAYAILGLRSGAAMVYR